MGNQYLFIVSQQKTDNSCIHGIIPTEKNDKMTELRLWRVPLDSQQTIDFITEINQEL